MTIQRIFKSIFWRARHFDIKRDIIVVVKKLNLGKNYTIELCRTDNPYIIVNAQQDKQVFLFNNRDKMLSDFILKKDRTWAWNEMDFMINYMSYVANQGGVFLDIGANVGTTSIYIKQRLGEKCSIYAFEPISENYKLLRANCILNNAEDIVTVNVGLSDKDRKVVMQTDTENMASSRMDDAILDVYRQNYDGNEIVEFIQLDKYVEKQNIDVSEVKGIWIDTEGNEPAVIRGGKDLFKNSDAPLYMEFNPKIYRLKDEYETFIADLMKLYKKFICFEDFSKGKAGARDIKELPLVESEMQNVFCNLLLLKK